MKKKGSYFLFKTVLAICLLAIMFALGIYFGMSTITAFRADCIRQEAETIDHALSLYSLSHQTVDTVRLDDKNRVQTTQKPCYPKSLAELGVLQTKFGYLSDLITFTDTIDTTTYGRFQYIPIEDEEDKGKEEYAENTKLYSSYTLKVRLPNGYVFTSPGSSNGGSQ